MGDIMENSNRYNIITEVRQQDINILKILYPNMADIPHINKFKTAEAYYIKNTSGIVVYYEYWLS